ncbi:protein-glutamate O-methyltransferase CheR [Heliobacterium chlorum]|uniref:protein-glutamate O-methyltransferase n=1 Tax=Heliobacterium chlorum TaxID=2698 RepID=A0ABR7SYI5_HELCL|nr:protein-glutamate O-methyltransferase CheR [Heliobacterium chlorum]MBC9783605.1 protein-glutamate O-methyltransferase CheR [Heliobacterium chlorum]
MASTDLKGFRLIQEYIEKECGIHLGDDKAYLIEGRLGRLLAESGARDFEEFYYRIHQQRDRAMAEKVIDAITTNETLWFRDKTPWKVLEEVLLPNFVEQFRAGKRFRVRIWSAACSTGQEPYSTAMCIDRYLREHGIKDITTDRFEILATDISPAVVQLARLGRYDSISMIRGMDDSYKAKYFQQEGRIWSIDEKIKKMIRFERFNLQDDYGIFGQFDIIFCRYVTIYFADTLKRLVLQKMARSLSADGVLFLGNSEIYTDYRDHFNVKEHMGGIYYTVKR